MNDNNTHFTLNDGHKIPSLGLGTWLSKNHEVGNAVKLAIKMGYRHIDCAQNYLNEMEIGDTLTELFKEGVVKREELFITSKLNNNYHHREHVEPILNKTLKDLNIEYLDLWLMHWPVAFQYVPYDHNVRGYDDKYDPDGCSQIDLKKFGGSKIDTTVTIRETWEAMEEMVKKGKVKSIGISNFTAPLIHDLLTYAKIKPTVNQVESHIYLQQPKLHSYLKSQNILFECYSPLGAGTFKKNDEPSVLKDEHIEKLAEKHKKSPAQICLRFQIQRGCVVIPKSVNEKRLKENSELFDFQLSEGEMKEISKLDRNYRFLDPSEWYNIPLFGEHN